MIEEDSILGRMQERGLLSGRDLFADADPDEPADEGEPLAPGTGVGRYRLSQRLGEGAMGEVWLAEDTELRRAVALKFLRGVGSQETERFLREGRLAARLSHPNIVRVHEMGEFRGRPYIVFEYVRGIPICERKLSLRELLEAIRKIGSALDHAHSMGILHRDIKPGNILIDENEVYVTDFGLAREVEGARLSHTGTILGTPAYMPPEQARGQLSRMDPRSDLYSLGATLYELAVGRPPYEGEGTLEVIDRVLGEKLPPPCRANPSIPRDVERIILKAMAPDMDRRYPTCREFAEDLARYLRGEPIRARPASLRYRAARAIRRRPLVFGLGAALVLLAGILGPALILQRRGLEAERRSSLDLMRRVSREATEAILQARRRGEGVHSIQEAMRSLLTQAHLEAAARAPELAEPDYLMGRVERSTMRYAEAETFQEKALAKDPGYPPALYERIVLLARRYGEECDRERRRLTPGVDSSGEALERVAGPLRVLRARIEELCGRLERSLRERPDEAVRLSEASVASARGILAAHQGRIDEARRLLSETVARDPSLEEAFETLAFVTEDLDEREKILNEAIRQDAGYLGHWMARATTRFRRARERKEPIEQLNAAESDCTHALKLDAGFADALVARGAVRANRALCRARLGQDPLPDFDAAEEDFARLIEQNRRVDEARSNRGAVRMNRGVHRAGRGEDPMPDWDLALKDFERLESADSFRGTIRMNRASFLAGRGEEADEEFRLAEADLTRAIERAPGDAAARAARAEIRLKLMGYLATRGRPTEEQARLCLEDLDRAIELAPGNPAFLTRRGALRTMSASLKAGGAADPGPDWDLAERDLTAALQLNRLLPDAWAWRGMIHAQRGLHLLARRQDPLGEWAMADRYLTQALNVNVNDAENFARRAEVRFGQAQLMERLGRSEARERYRQAAEDFERASELAPGLKERLQERLRQARARSGAEY